VPVLSQAEWPMGNGSDRGGRHTAGDLGGVTTEEKDGQGKLTTRRRANGRVAGVLVKWGKTKVQVQGTTDKNLEVKRRSIR